MRRRQGETMYPAAGVLSLRARVSGRNERSGTEGALGEAMGIGIKIEFVVPIERSAAEAVAHASTGGCE